MARSLPPHWDDEQISSFLRVYERYPILWDMNDRHHKIKWKVNDALRSISGELASVGMEVPDIEILRKKIKSIRDMLP